MTTIEVITKVQKVFNLLRVPVTVYGNLKYIISIPFQKKGDILSRCNLSYLFNIDNELEMLGVFVEGQDVEFIHSNDLSSMLKKGVEVIQQYKE